MMQPPADLIKTDQQHLIHPLHDHTEAVIYVRGCGAKVYDITGREYIDGLSGLWNVNVGHGRAVLADAAATQMKELAYSSARSHQSDRWILRGLRMPILRAWRDP
jgi:adenosylmethionine-8-amino-7-oxononanoate aminotransferase